MVNCCTDPFLAGTGYIDVNQKILPGNVHLTAKSPCIGAGTAGVIFGTEIDSQPWNNPPSLGWSAWQTLQTILNSGGGVIQITDASATNGSPFYQVVAQ